MKKSTGWAGTSAAIFIIFLAYVVRVVGAYVGGSEADVAAFYNHVMTVREGMSVYKTELQYPYLPGWLIIEISTFHVAQLFGIEFWQLIRLLIILCDLLVCALIGVIVKAQDGGRNPLHVSLLYAWSPIVILIAGFHGQFDSVSMLFSLLSYYLIMRRSSSTLAGIFLGLAIAVKPHQVLLLPVLMWAKRTNLKCAAIFGLAAVLTVAAISLPYMADDLLTFQRNILKYQGVTDQGIGGLLRSLWLHRSLNFYLPGTFGDDIAKSTKLLALSLMFLSFVRCSGSTVPHIAAAIYLAFLCAYSGAGTQYLTWPLAWLYLTNVKLRITYLYSIATALGAIGFYLVFWPRLIWPYGPTGMNTEFLREFLAGEAISWLAIVATYVVVMRKGRLADFKFSRYVLGFACLLALVSSVPVIRQVAWLLKEWYRYRGY